MSTKNKVLIANRFDHHVLLKAKQSSSFEFLSASELGELKSDFSDAKALIVRSSSKLDRDLLKKFPKLKLIVTGTSGFDHIDLDAAKELGIRCCHTPNAQKVAAAEMTILLMFASLRKFSLASRQMKKGNWQRSLLTGEQVSGKNLGIVGLGRVGKEVAKRAIALGLEVSAFDPYLNEENPGITMLGFEELMRSSDVVTLHVPKTKRTRYMIKKDTLDWMDPQALLINMSRGDVINEAELIAHLQDQKDFRVALDVFRAEPLSTSSTLLELNNVTVSPHIGASTTEALRMSSQECINQVNRFFVKGQLEDELPPSAHWWGE